MQREFNLNEPAKRKESRLDYVQTEVSEELNLPAQIIISKGPSENEANDGYPRQKARTLFAYGDVVKNSKIDMDREILEEKFMNALKNLEQQFIKGNSKEVKKLIKELNIKPFDGKKFIQFDQLGAGGFGQVYRFWNKETEHFDAIKIVELKKDESNLNFFQDTLKNLLSEIKILKLISEKSIKGALQISEIYYILNKDILTLYVVSELGDCNMVQLLNERISENPKAPYSDEEILQFLKFLLQTLTDFHKACIFHSDLKLDNIVYNKSKGDYFIVDFGMSALIPKGQESVPIFSYFAGGTKSNWSPELKDIHKKAKSWKSNESLIKIENIKFNPYKFDVWCVGKICQRLCTNYENRPVIKEFLDSALIEDINKRPYAEALLEKVQKNIIKLKIKAGLPDEAKFFKKIEKARILSFGNDILKLYEKAEQPNQCLAIALEREKDYIQSNKDIYKMEYVEALNLLGRYYGDCQHYEESIKTLEKAQRINDFLEKTKKAEIAELLAYQYESREEFSKATEILQGAFVIEDLPQSHPDKDQEISSTLLRVRCSLAIIYLKMAKEAEFRNETFKVFNLLDEQEKLGMESMNLVRNIPKESINIIDLIELFLRKLWDNNLLDERIRLLKGYNVHYQKISDPVCSQVSLNLFEIGKCYQKMKRSKEAIKYWCDSISLDKKIYKIEFNKQIFASYDYICKELFHNRRFDDCLILLNGILDEAKLYKEEETVNRIEKNILKVKKAKADLE